MLGSLVGVDFWTGEGTIAASLALDARASMWLCDESRAVVKAFLHEAGGAL